MHLLGHNVMNMQNENNFIDFIVSLLKTPVDSHHYKQLIVN